MCYLNTGLASTNMQVNLNAHTLQKPGYTITPVQSPLLLLHLARIWPKLEIYHVTYTQILFSPQIQPHIKLLLLQVWEEITRQKELAVPHLASFKPIAPITPTEDEHIASGTLLEVYKRQESGTLHSQQH